MRPLRKNNQTRQNADMENQEPKLTGCALQRPDGTLKTHLPARKTITAANLIDELIQIAQTINEYASGSKPWGGCRCDYGEDGRMPLRGDKCGRCKALERLKEITQHNETTH